MYRFFLVWSVAIAATCLQIHYQRKSEIIPPQQAEVFVNNHHYRVLFLRSYDGTGDAELKIRINSRDVTGRVFFRNYQSKDEWLYSDLGRRGAFLVGYIPRPSPLSKVEYFFEFSENSEIVSVERNRPTVLSFTGKIPRAILLTYITFIFIALLMSNIAGLYVVADNLSYRLYAGFTASFLLIVTFVLSPIVHYYSFSLTSISIGNFIQLFSLKFMLFSIVWLIAVFLDRKKNKPQWISLTALLLFATNIIPSLIFD